MTEDAINRYCACCGDPTKSPVHGEDSAGKKWTYCSGECLQFHQTEVLEQ